MYELWGKKTVVLREITPYVSIIQAFQNLLGDFKSF